jgi:hypothetical protein
MAVIYACLGIVGTLCVLDLLMTFAVIRRLREHSELLRGGDPFDMPVVSLAAGQVPQAGPQLTLAGEPLSGLTGIRLAGFFSTSCSICPERVAPFVAYVTEHKLARDSVLAVIVRNEDELPPYLGQLTAVARACAEGNLGPLGKAFGVMGFPAFCVLDDNGAVVASGFDPATLPVPVAVS